MWYHVKGKVNLLSGHFQRHAMCALYHLNAITIGHLVRTTNCQVGSIDSSVSAQQSEPRKTFVFSFTEMKQDQHL